MPDTEQLDTADRLRAENALLSTRLRRWREEVAVAARLLQSGGSVAALKGLQALLRERTK